MLFWNIFVFFLLPLLVLFLTRKLSVRGMILWTAGVQVVALLLRMVVYPVRLSLSWGMSLLRSRVVRVKSSTLEAMRASSSNIS